MTSESWGPCPEKSCPWSDCRKYEHRMSRTEYTRLMGEEKCPGKTHTDYSRMLDSDGLDVLNCTCGASWKPDWAPVPA